METSSARLAAEASDSPYSCGTSAPTSSVLLDSGDTTSGEATRSGDRAVTANDYRWVLWDLAAKRRVVSGTFNGPRGPFVPPVTDLVGQTLMVPIPTGFELRSATDGSVHTRVDVDGIADANRSGLSSDASYAYVTTDDTLTVWDTRGRLLVSIRGDYRRVEVYAHPTELRIGSPQNTLTRVAVPDGTVVTTSFTGRFEKWFDDGEHFITSELQDAHIYTSTGVLVRTFPGGYTDDRNVGPDSGGVGGRARTYWTTSPYRILTRVFSLDAAEPVLEVIGRPFRTRSPRSADLLFRGEGTKMTWLDLRSGTPVAVPVETGTIEGGENTWNNYASAASDAEGGWVFSTTGGPLHFGRLDGAKPDGILGCGRINAMGGVDDTLAVATSDRHVRLFTVGPSNVTLIRTVPEVATAHTRITDIAVGGGGRFAVAYAGSKWDNPYHFIRAFRVHDGKPLYLWANDLDHSLPGGGLRGFGVAADGDRIARRYCRARTDLASLCLIIVSDLGGVDLWQSPITQGNLEYGLAPRGDLLAVTTAEAEGRYTTLILRDGELLTSLEDTWFVNWIDDERLLVQRRVLMPGETRPLWKAGMDVVDIHGKPSRTLPVLARSGGPTYHGPNYYPADGSSIFRIADGTLAWTVREDLKSERDKGGLLTLRSSIAFMHGTLVRVDHLP